MIMIIIILLLILESAPTIQNCGTFGKMSVQLYVQAVRVHPSYTTINCIGAFFVQGALHELYKLEFCSLKKSRIGLGLVPQGMSCLLYKLYKNIEKIFHYNPCSIYNTTCSINTTKSKQHEVFDDLVRKVCIVRIEENAFLT